MILRVNFVPIMMHHRTIISNLCPVFRNQSIQRGHKFSSARPKRVPSFTGAPCVNANKSCDTNEKSDKFHHCRNLSLFGGDGGFGPHPRITSFRSSARSTLASGNPSLAGFLHRWPRPTISGTQKGTAVAVPFCVPKSD